MLGGMGTTCREGTCEREAVHCSTGPEGGPRGGSASEETEGGDSGPAGENGRDRGARIPGTGKGPHGIHENGLGMGYRRVGLDPGLNGVFNKDYSKM